MNRINLLIISFLFGFTIIVNAQFQGFDEVPDSLILKSHHSLYTLFYNSYNQLEESNIYATAFLKKAYINKDTLNLANGYYMITYHTTEDNLVFNDSLLKYSAFLPKRESSSFAWYAYQGMGGYYAKKRDFKKAFDNHIKALNAAKQVNDSSLQNISTTNLALLKERVGKYQEALIDFRYNYQYELEKFNNTTIEDTVSLKSFLNSMCLIANSYRLNKKYDSAQYFNNKVFNYKNHSVADRYIGLAGVNSAEVEFDLGNYNSTIDSINNILPILLKQNNIPNIAVAYYLRGMSHTINDKKTAIDDLILMDSIFSLNKDLQPSLRSGYLYLIDYYKKRSNIQKQLYYVEQLLKFDSIVYNYSMYVSEGVFHDERKDLLSTQISLKTEINKASAYTKIIISISCFIVILLILEIFRRTKLNKKRIIEYQYKFDELLKTSSEKRKSEKIKNNKTKDIEISESLVQEIVLKLKIFEAKKGFLDKKISANKLAKELNTNANYLGQIIKHKYQENFRQYINNMRIEYILKILRQDPKMIKYSIQAIANEAGFNHTEPFSKAFKTRTGYYPSDFIIKIKEEKVMKIVS